MQLSLFDNTNSIDIKEAPGGFYAVSKSEAQTPNVCNSCDAKSLCVENKDNWCLINRCMSFEIVSNSDNKIYCRKDKQSVYFKRSPKS
jgi:hypothetical protein